MNVRPESAADLPAIYLLNASAFETHAEADLVDALRHQVPDHISLVADTAHEIVGHIMFTPVALSGCDAALIMGLAPMAVKTEFRNLGIGSALIRSGLETCAEARAGAIVVLGYPDYYTRFGFVAASKFALSCEYDVPDDVFMAREIIPGYLADKSGTITYHELFAGV